MRRLQLAWAALPAFLALFLVWHASREDGYSGDGRSYWETHPEVRTFVVGAVLIDIAAAGALALSRGRTWLAVVGGALTVVGLFVTGAAAVALGAN